MLARAVFGLADQAARPLCSLGLTGDIPETQKKWMPFKVQARSQHCAAQHNKEQITGERTDSGTSRANEMKFCALYSTHSDALFP